jgi:hypothetical protein
MTAANESSKKYWMYFGISFVIIVLLLAFASEFFWVALPFVLTFLVKALDAI